jgi:hypothetical protein
MLLIGVPGKATLAANIEASGVCCCAVSSRHDHPFGPVNQSGDGEMVTMANIVDLIPSMTDQELLVLFVPQRDLRKTRRLMLRHLLWLPLNENGRRGSTTHERTPIDTTLHQSECSAPWVTASARQTAQRQRSAGGLSLVVAATVLGATQASSEEVGLEVRVRWIDNGVAAGTSLDRCYDTDWNTSAIKEGESELPEMIAIIDSNR